MLATRAEVTGRASLRAGIDVRCHWDESSGGVAT